MMIDVKHEGTGFGSETVVSFELMGHLSNEEAIAEVISDSIKGEEQ